MDKDVKRFVPLSLDLFQPEQVSAAIARVIFAGAPAPTVPQLSPAEVYGAADPMRPEEAKHVDWVVILDADMIIRGPIIPWELGAERGRPFAAHYGYSYLLFSHNINLNPFFYLLLTPFFYMI